MTQQVEFVVSKDCIHKVLHDFTPCYVNDTFPAYCAHFDGGKSKRKKFFMVVDLDRNFSLIPFVSKFSFRCAMRLIKILQKNGFLEYKTESPFPDFEGQLPFDGDNVTVKLKLEQGE